MTPRARRVTAADVLRVLQADGFRIVRQRGSHCILRSDEGRRVSVPLHAGRTLHPTVLASIARDAELSPADFE